MLENEALESLNSGELDKSIDIYSRILNVDCSNPIIHNNISVAYLRKGEFLLAKQHLESSLELCPDYDNAVSNYGICLNLLGDYGQALKYLYRAIEINKNHFLSYKELVSVLLKTGDVDQANKIFKAILNMPGTENVLIDILQATSFEVKNLNFFKKNLKRVLNLYPKCASLHVLIGQFFQRNCSFDKAISAYNIALKLDENNLETALVLSWLYSECGNFQLAINTLLSVNDNNDPRYFYNLGINYFQLKKLDSASKYYAIAYEINPLLPCLAGDYLFTLNVMCDFSKAHLVYNFIIANCDKVICAPFNIVSKCNDPIAAKNITECFADWYCPDARTKEFKRYDNPKIRIGYYSADIYEHATSYLMANVFESHDRNKFEIFCFDYSPPKNDAMKIRVKNAFDHYEHVGNLSDESVAILSRELQIDIAVDLKGYTTNSRLGIMRFGAAPIQIHLLGYPGTLGTKFIDYIVGDYFTTPIDHASFYTEKIVRMPDSYQMNDPYRSLPTMPVTRADYNLPEDSFVLCCFNNNYKITQDFFDVWLEVLSETTNTVLWLYLDNEWARKNLLDYAKKYPGIENRIYFAPRVSSHEHISRHKLANLFLDTSPCNAHTTASDSLWAGLPLITLAGKTFAGRVAGSLLKSLGLEKYICETISQYKQQTLELCTNVELYNKSISDFRSSIVNANIFNSVKYTRDIEALYLQLHIEGSKAVRNYFKN